LPSQHQHSTLQKTYCTNYLNFEPDGTAFSEHNAFHQSNGIARRVLGIWVIGFVDEESDCATMNEEMLTFCEA
jgi:hypothetical protein